MITGKFRNTSIHIIFIVLTSCFVFFSRAQSSDSQILKKEILKVKKACDGYKNVGENIPKKLSRAIQYVKTQCKSECQNAQYQFIQNVYPLMSSGDKDDTEVEGKETNVIKNPDTAVDLLRSLFNYLCVPLNVHGNQETDEDPKYCITEQAERWLSSNNNDSTMEFLADKKNTHSFCLPCLDYQINALTTYEDKVHQILSQGPFSVVKSRHNLIAVKEQCPIESLQNSSEKSSSKTMRDIFFSLYYTTFSSTVLAFSLFLF